MAEKTNALVVKNYNIAQAKDMQAMAKVLKDHIVKHKLYSNIKGKNYVEVEGWQFAGGMLGVLPEIVDTIDLSTDKEKKWKAEVRLFDVKDQTKTLGRGFAICSDKEAKKKNFDEYAILSMAETRAIGKAYRSSIGWVMKVAGYEATPTEEMDSKMAKGDTASDNPATEDAIEKIGRMRSIPALDKVQENIANSKKYNAKEKQTIQKAIDEQKEKLSEK